jgi:hypothetical protein
MPAYAPADCAVAPAADVPLQVVTLLRGLHATPGEAPERRKDRRYPFPYLVRLSPVGSDGTTPSGQPVVVVGKHLSERGFGFYHPEPLAYRRMVATLETPGGDRLSLLIDLSWCRFTGRGWYESGGRFLAVVDAP